MSLSLHDGAELLRTMTPIELQLFAAAAGILVLRHGDLGAGMVEALKMATRDRAKAGAA